MDSDLRVGGKWRTEGKRHGRQAFTVSGEYTRIEPPRVLGFTWNHDWGDTPMPETHVLVELTPTSSGTHVTVTHSGFTDATARDSHNQGWMRVLGWLRGYLQHALIPASHAMTAATHSIHFERKLDHGHAA